MGRKIPGKKHRGVRDPLMQIALKNKSIAGKVNAPPKDPDYQAIPKSALRIMELTKGVKDGTIPTVKKNRKKNKNKSGLISTATTRKPVKRPGRPEKAVPVFEQAPGESNPKFLYRIHQVVQSVLKEAEFEDKYKVDVQRNFQTGEVEGVKKREKDEIDELMKKSAETKKKKKKKLDADGVKKTRPNKKQRHNQKLEAKTKRKEELHKDGFAELKDVVKFGEVVHAPPELKFFPKGAQKSENTGKPKNKDLLLSNLLDPKKQINSKVNQQISASKVLTGKRKDLPEATREKLEKQRLDVVNAYKLLKAERNKKD